MIEKLINSVKDCKQLLIFTHNNPDPDSISSAFTLKFILEKLLKIKSTITYGGIIGREENKMMVKQLDIHLKHISTINIKQFSHFALTDCQPMTGNNSFPKKKQTNNRNRSS